MAGDPGFWDVAWNWPLPFVTAVAALAVPMAGIIWFIGLHPVWMTPG
jgi:hypothetical protein